MVIKKLFFIFIILLSVVFVYAQLPDDANNRIDFFYDEVEDESKTYLPKSFDVIYSDGFVGNISSINLSDENYLVIEENNGANAWQFNVNFTGVTSFSNLILRERYNGGAGHNIKIGLFDCDDGGYEEEYTPDITDMDNFAFSLYNILDQNEHVCTGGNVSIQLRHVDNGINTHSFELDYIALQTGATTVVAEESDPNFFSWLAEAVFLRHDGTIAWTGNEDGNSFNTTGWDYGFFNFLGNSVSRITKLWVQDIDSSGTINANNITLEGIINDNNTISKVYFNSDGTFVVEG